MLPKNFYKELAIFRVNTVKDIGKRSKRSPKLIYDSFDKELTRIANSIQKGYTLGSNRITEIKEFYRPYKYFNIMVSVLNHPEVDRGNKDAWAKVYRSTNPPEIKIIITRGEFNITITDEEINKLMAWCNGWKIRKPATLEECENVNFYQRWW